MVDHLQTLVLNQHYMPHQILPWTAAVCLTYTEKADAIEVYEATVSSPSMTIHVPAVIRLRRDIGFNKQNVKFSRPNMLARDGYRCCYCGLRKKAKELTYDHVIPRSRWKGPIHKMTSWENVVMSCKPCNTRKGDRTPKEAGMRMHFQPYKPLALPMGQPLLVDVATMPEPWRRFILPVSRSA